MLNYLKTAAILAAKAGAPAILRRFKKQDSLTLLSLHRVSPEVDYFWQPLHPTRFEALCAYVQRHYQVVNLRDLAQLPPRRAADKPRLILSFDDGYHDFIEYALPVLHRFGLPANHNLVVACLDDNYVIWSQRLNHSFAVARAYQQPLPVDSGVATFALTDFGGQWMPFYLAVFKHLLTQPATVRETVLTQLEAVVGEIAQVRMMTWAEARTLADYDVEVGSHTHFHDVMPTITNSAVLHHELIASRQRLREGLAQPITVLALPNGQNDTHLQPFIAEAGYDYVLETGDQGNVFARPVQPGPVCLRRINIVDEIPDLAQLRLEILALK